MPAKLSDAEVRRRLSRKNLILLDIHDPSRELSEVLCTRCKQTWSSTRDAFRSIVSGPNRCPFCRPNRKLTDREIEKRLKSFGLSMISRTGRSVALRCDRCKGTWKRPAARVRSMAINSYGGCPHCSRTKAVTQKQAERRYSERGLTLLGTYLNNRTKVNTRCTTCGYRWKTRPHDIFSDNGGCPKCQYRKVSEKRRVPQSRVAQRLRKIGVSIIGEYYGISYDTTLVCRACGTEWISSCHEVLRGHRLCPDCFPTGNGGSIEEERVRLIFERLTGWKFPRSSPTWLRGRGTRSLQLDGYNKEHGVAFEYQGFLHYQNCYGSKRLAQSRRSDNRKRCLARYYGVVLIRVPYWKRNVEDFIRSRLEKAGIL
jgi:hypothetical protein